MADKTQYEAWLSEGGTVLTIPENGEFNNYRSDFDMSNISKIIIPDSCKEFKMYDHNCSIVYHGTELSAKDIDHARFNCDFFTNIGVVALAEQVKNNNISLDDDFSKDLMAKTLLQLGAHCQFGTGDIYYSLDAATQAVNKFQENKSKILNYFKEEFGIDDLDDIWMEVRDVNSAITYFHVESQDEFDPVASYSELTEKMVKNDDPEFLRKISPEVDAYMHQYPDLTSYSDGCVYRQDELIAYYDPEENYFYDTSDGDHFLCKLQQDHILFQLDDDNLTQLFIDCYRTEHPEFSHISAIITGKDVTYDEYCRHDLVGDVYITGHPELKVAEFYYDNYGYGLYDEETEFGKSCHDCISSLKEELDLREKFDGNFHPIVNKDGDIVIPFSCKTGDTIVAKYDAQQKEFTSVDPVEVKMDDPSNISAAMFAEFKKDHQGFHDLSMDDTGSICNHGEPVAWFQRTNRIPTISVYADVDYDNIRDEFPNIEEALQEFKNKYPEFQGAAIGNDGLVKVPDHTDRPIASFSPYTETIEEYEDDMTLIRFQLAHPELSNCHLTMDDDGCVYKLDDNGDIENPDMPLALYDKDSGICVEQNNLSGPENDLDQEQELDAAEYEDSTVN